MAHSNFDPIKPEGLRRALTALRLRRVYAARVVALPRNFVRYPMKIRALFKVWGVTSAPCIMG
jgi:predicted aminopeptidase